MKNFITFSGQDPLSIRATGTGEYVKDECAKLVDTFADSRADALEEIRQDETDTNYHYNE